MKNKKVRDTKNPYFLRSQAVKAEEILNPYVLKEKIPIELPHLVIKCKSGAHNKYGELKQIQFGSTKCSCRPNHHYFLRNRKSKVGRKKYCFIHTLFDSGFYNDNIEEKHYFTQLVQDLNTFNKLNSYIRASLYYEFFLDEDGFYRNAVILCNACSTQHPNICKDKIDRLMHFLYRYLNQEIKKDSKTEKGEVCHCGCKEDDSSEEDSEEEEEEDKWTDYSDPGSVDESDYSDPGSTDEK